MSFAAAGPASADGADRRRGAQLSQTAVGLINAGHEADWLTDSVAVQIAAQQRRDGRWTDGHSTSRAPMEESEITDNGLLREGAAGLHDSVAEGGV